MVWSQSLMLHPQLAKEREWRRDCKHRDLQPDSTLWPNVVLPFGGGQNFSTKRPDEIARADVRRRSKAERDRHETVSQFRAASLAAHLSGRFHVSKHENSLAIENFWQFLLKALPSMRCREFPHVGAELESEGKIQLSSLWTSRTLLAASGFGFRK